MALERRWAREAARGAEDGLAGEIPLERITSAPDMLTALGFTVSAAGKTWNIKTPSWRHDVEGAADIVEEILRINGYDNIPALPVLPVCTTSVAYTAVPTVACCAALGA